MFKSETGNSLSGIDDPRYSGSMPRALNAIGEQAKATAQHLARNSGSPFIDDTNNRTFWARIYGKYERAGAGKGYEFRVRQFDADGQPFYMDSDEIFNCLFDINGNKGLMAGQEVLVMRTDGGTVPERYYIIPAIPHALFPVKVTYSAGADGDSTNAATWTYTVKTIDDAYTLSTSAMGPVWARASKGPMVKATHGTGYYTAAGTFVLYQVDEQEDSTICTSY